MKRMNGTTLLASCAILGLGAAAASADCAEEIAALQSGNASGAQAETSATDEGVSKDGSLAPLEEAEDDADAQDDFATASTSGENSAAEQGDEEIAKDGTQAPLEEDQQAEGQSDAAPGENEGAIAVSQQATEEQQDQAPPGSDGNARSEALERAQAALERGDEEACMSAVEEARSL